MLHGCAAGATPVIRFGCPLTDSVLPPFRPTKYAEKSGRAESSRARAGLGTGDWGRLWKAGAGEGMEQGGALR